MGTGRVRKHVQQVDVTGRVNRLYAVLSNVNEAIVRVREPQELYESACRIAVDDGHFILAWIGFVEPESQVIQPIAKYGLDDGYLDSIRLSLSEDVPEGRGPTGVALREGRPFINNDTENNPVMRPWRDEQLKRGFRSSASFPLKSAGTTTGVITLYAGEPDYFDDEEIRLLGCLADDFSFALESAAIAAQRAKALQALKESQEELEVRVAEVTAAFEDLVEERTVQAAYAEGLNRINDGVHSTLDFDEIMDRAMSEIVDVLNVDAAVVQARVEDHWEFAYSFGLSEDLKSRRMSDAEVPLSMKVSETREPIFVTDVAHDDRVNIRTMKDFGITALMAVPLIIRREVFGVLVVDRFGEPAPFSRQQLDFLQRAAATLALGLENARLFEGEASAKELAGRELARTGLLQDVAIAVSTGTTVVEVCDRSLLAAAEHWDLRIGAVYTYDEAGECLDLLTSFGITDKIVERISRFDMRKDRSTLAVRAARERRAVASEDVSPTKARREMLKQSGTEDLEAIAVPLEANGALLGTLSLIFADRGAFDEDERDLVRSVAGILGQAIENARLYESAQDAARLSDALNGVNASVHASLELDEVMQHALEAGIQALGCDSGAIEMYEHGEWVVRYQSGFSIQDIGIHMGSDQAPNAARAASELRAFAVTDMSHDEKLNVGFVKRYDLRSVLAVPLIARTQVIGCALFYSAVAVRRFADSEVDFGRKLGSTVSLALENARLYAAERGIAETLQQALLALPEHLTGIEFAPYYRSATESTLVGGDFYDMFDLDERHIGITIGDIAGKGLPAAVLTSLVRNTIRAHALEKGKSPAQVLSLTNDVVAKSTQVQEFATVFFGILDREDGRLLYANAGHTTSVIVRQDGTLSLLEATGPILGAFGDLEFGQAETSLEQCEMLFLYTDGLTEARCDGELYGEERVFADLLSTAHASAQDAAENAVAKVMSFSGNHLRDDLAILVVRRLETEA